MCLHLLLGPASSSRIFRVFYQQNSLPALSIVKNVSHARKTDFSHEKPVALWILADHCRGGGVWTNELGILPVFWASHPVFLSIQQRMGAKGGSGPSARSGVGRLRESGDFVVGTICLLLLGHKWIAYFLCSEIRMVWAGRICIDVVVGVGMSQRPNSNPASSPIHLGKHTFISSTTLLTLRNMT